MYLWKCWRDTRAAFFIFLGALVLAALAHRLVAADWLGLASSGLFRTSRAMWEQGVEAMLVTSVFAMPLVGFVLGAQGVGAEFERRTIPFLLTRPRHRFFYLWASWLVGAVEVVALVAISILLYASRSHMPSSPPASSANGALGAVAAMMVPAGVIYCLTFCFTVFLKKEQHGTTAAVAAIFSYSGIFVVIRLIYNIKLPIFWELYVGAFNPAKPLPLLSVSVWLGLALAFVAASHFHFQNAEA